MAAFYVKQYSVQNCTSLPQTCQLRSRAPVESWHTLLLQAALQAFRASCAAFRMSLAPSRSICTCDSTVNFATKQRVGYTIAGSFSMTASASMQKRGISAIAELLDQATQAHQQRLRGKSCGQKYSMATAIAANRIKKNTSKTIATSVKCSDLV